MRIQLCFLIFLGMLATSCSWEEVSQPSVLVIAVESLGFETVSCGGQSAESLQAFKVFCSESVRFTNAFTPSTMSLSAISSILTGQYPSEHGVWHNGSQFLSAKIKTLPEVALSKGLRTSFFSGGAPVWSKGGIAQGFELFDDKIKVNVQNYYRPLETNIDNFLKWSGSHQQPLFSFIYANDLQFPDSVTVNDKAEERSFGFNSQLQEIDESLYKLIKELKRRKQWDKMNIVLVGLNSQDQKNREGELPTTGLYSEQTQVSLFVKPQRKQRDEAIKWSIDRNVTLVDLGMTLFDLYGQKGEEKEKALQAKSFLKAFHQPNLDWPASRVLLLESGWAQWRGVGSSRFAARRGHYLYIHDKTPKLYNSLTDRLEQSAMGESEPIWKNITSDIQSFFRTKGIYRWDSISASLIDKLKLGSQFFRENDRREESLNRAVLLLDKRPWDKQLWSWLAGYAIEQKDWRLLKKLAEEANQSIWLFVAKEHLGIKQKVSFSGCEGYFLSQDMSSFSQKICDNKLFINLLKVVFEKDQIKKEELFTNFFRLYRLRYIDRKILALNFINYLKWDVAVSDSNFPSYTDLYLTLPQSQWVRFKLQKEFNKIK